MNVKIFPKNVWYENKFYPIFLLLSILQYFLKNITSIQDIIIHSKFEARVSITRQYWLSRNSIYFNHIFLDCSHFFLRRSEFKLLWKFDLQFFWRFVEFWHRNVPFFQARIIFKLLQMSYFIYVENIFLKTDIIFYQFILSMNH